MAPDLPALTGDEVEITARLRTHVRQLAEVIGPRNVERFEQLQQAADYIKGQFAQSRYTADCQPFRVEGREVANIEATRASTRPPRQFVVIGAHYDSVANSPGANDNASGVAVLLELARLTGHACGRTAVRFVAFVNEEPPYFMTDAMGSLVYARRAAVRRERISAMLSLETLGYYCDVPGSQQYPAPFHLLFPDRGNFVAIVSNFRSANLLRRVRSAFTKATPLPVIASPAPEGVPGVGWSDHWSFWQQGYRAVMLTDTAPYRYPYYHSREDTPDKIDYERLARVVTGCLGVIRSLT